MLYVDDVQIARWSAAGGH